MDLDYDSDESYEDPDEIYGFIDEKEPPKSDIPSMIALGLLKKRKIYRYYNYLNRK